MSSLFNHPDLYTLQQRNRLSAMVMLMIFIILVLIPGIGVDLLFNPDVGVRFSMNILIGIVQAQAASS